MPNNEVMSGEPCPLCLLQKGQITPMVNRPGQHYAQCGTGQHKFEDTEELRTYQKQARAKFPAVYTPAAKTNEPDMAQFANQDLVITAEIKKTMEDAAGVAFTGAADMKGVFLAFAQDNKDQETEIKRLRAQIGAMSRRNGGTQVAAGVELGLGQYIITVPEWAMEGGIAAAAEHDGMTEQDWIQNEMNAYLENYFNPQMQQRR
jgi:hypothetical protein